MRLVITVVCCLVACGKSNKESGGGEGGKYGADFTKNCKSSVAVVAPWTDFALPVGDGRVCSSTEQRTQIEFLTKTRAELEAAFEQALVAKGYTKEKCSDSKGMVPRCTYFKKPPIPRHEVTVDVHAMAESANGVKDAKLVTVTITTQGGMYQP